MLHLNDYEELSILASIQRVLMLLVAFEEACIFSQPDHTLIASWRGALRGIQLLPVWRDHLVYDRKVE
jgi:hypothetical protein